MDHQDQYAHIVVFDGICNLCNSTVDFLLKNDPNGRLSFVPLQILNDSAHFPPGLPNDLQDNTVMFIDRGILYTRSAAALRIAGYLRFPWPLLRVFAIIPLPVRDWLYDIIARNRYRWFGKKKECRVPGPEDPYAGRFIQDTDQVFLRISESKRDKTI